MKTQNLLSIINGGISFGKKVIFEDLSLNISNNDKITLVGKNGTGKSTLMDIITENKDLDSGKIIKIPEISIGYLKQDVKYPPSSQTILQYLSHNDDNKKHNIEYICNNIALDYQKNMLNLSGGESRKLGLVKILIDDHSLLILDEPTNHLDFKAAQWLESFLIAYNKAIICVSHDKTFLENISNKIFWLDRGNIKVCPKGYKYFDQWSSEILRQEEKILENRDKFIKQEQRWVERGVTARRKRNVRRMDNFHQEFLELKKDKSEFRKINEKIKIPQIKIQNGSKIIADVIKISKQFGKNEIIKDFSLKISRGDRIGILGDNGSGKSSFLKMLLGEMAVDSGKIKLANNLTISFFDQQRSTIDDQKTLKENLCDGGEYVEIAGKKKHVCGYLKDFLFDPSKSEELAQTLSGGQKSRLALAKTLAKTGELLILDEPTNDLDSDSLENLKYILGNYKGTLLIVSHDRNFLDSLINKIMVFKAGKVECYIGNYTDYFNQKKEKKIIKNKEKKEITKNKNNNKLTYKLEFELKNLPEKIEKLKQEKDKIEAIFVSDKAVKNGIDPELTKKHGQILTAIETSEQRWLELELIKENYEK